MRKLSFQWRITLMTALLIAIACITLNLLLFRSGSVYIDAIGQYVFDYEDGDISITVDGEEDALYVDLTDDQFREFMSCFSDVLDNTKEGFGQRGWLITAAVTQLSAVVAYFVSGHSLKPLRRFSAQAEQIQTKTLTEIRLNEDTIPEFQALSRSINRMLERLSEGFEDQRQFTGNAAHELRTPLALMQARLELYEKEHPESAPETAETFNLIKEQTARLSRMVKTLLDMSALETVGKTDRVELGPMVEEVLTDLTLLAEKHSVTLEQTGEDVSLTGSDVLLYRLLFNLVENAVKYNCPGGSVTVFTRQEAGNAVIRVHDTGQGIPEQHRYSIFQPFYRVDKSRSRDLGGVGLGLSLVWEIARLHGGTVQIGESSETGTEIVVTLPLSGEQHSFR